VRENTSPEAGPALLALRRRAARLAVPVFAVWEVTYRCPLRCRHCYLAGKRDEDELSAAEGKALLADMARLGVLFLSLTGGEPLLREDLFDIVDEALTLGFTWQLLTSGTLLDEERARRVAERTPLAVEVSLHGLEKTHEWITGVDGSFRAAVAALERLARLDLTVNVKMSLTPRGLKDLPGLRSLCRTLGANLKVSTMMFPDCEGRPTPEDLRLDDQLLAQYISESEIGPSDPLVQRAPLRDDGPLCGAGRSSFSVSPGGDVRPCLTLVEPCGNVRSAPLGDIWHSKAMAAFRRLTTSSRKGCLDCEHAEFCNFCPGLAEREAGDALLPPPSACREASVRHRLYLEDRCRGASSDGRTADSRILRDDCPGW